MLCKGRILKLRNLALFKGSFVRIYTKELKLQLSRQKAETPNFRKVSSGMMLFYHFLLKHCFTKRAD